MSKTLDPITKSILVKTLRESRSRTLIITSIAAMTLVFLNACGDGTEHVVDNDNSSTADTNDLPNAILEETGEFRKTLSTGFEIKAKAEGIESTLLGYIESNDAIGDDKWFKFDRLSFAEGNSQIEIEQSMNQLTNMAEILRAFPNVALTVGGYTDSIGSEEANIETSQARAQAVVNALVELGADGSRLEPKGYGIAHPMASNDPEEGRVQGGQIAVLVTAK